MTNDAPTPEKARCDFVVNTHPQATYPQCMKAAKYAHRTPSCTWFYCEKHWKMILLSQGDRKEFVWNSKEFIHV